MTPKEKKDNVTPDELLDFTISFSRDATGAHATKLFGKKKPKLDCDEDGFTAKCGNKGVIVTDGETTTTCKPSVTIETEPISTCTGVVSF